MLNNSDNNLMNNVSITKENLDKNNYTLSIIKEGVRVGVINEEDLLSMQNQIINILKDLVIKYNLGDSTSIRTDKAADMLNSIYYTIDLFLYNLNNLDECIKILMKNQLEEIYKEGKRIIQDLIEETKELYKHIKYNKLKIPLVIYNSTIYEAIPDFFANYNINYFSHDIMTSIDYPLVFDDMKVKGISYINQYLEKLNIETEICKIYDEVKVNELLESYGDTYNIEYKNSPINIFEIVVNNSILSIMIGYGSKNIIHPEYRKDELLSILLNMNAVELDNFINIAFNKLIDENKIKDYKQIEYLNKYMHTFKIRLLNALENKELNYLFITNQKNNSVKKLNKSRRLDDKSFRYIINRLKKANGTYEKISIIKKYVNSIEDIIDIFKSDYIIDNEFAEIFKNLSSLELALLGKIVYREELRDNNINIFKDDNAEISWIMYYKKHINTLGKEEIEIIKKLINAEIIYNKSIDLL